VIFKENIFAGDQFHVICHRKEYYVLKKYHVIIIKEDWEQGIYHMGKRLNALCLLCREVGKESPLGVGGFS
jgi:hypothetical protein